MEYRRLGKSGLQVSVLSFGSWVTFGNQIGNSTAKELMAYAYDQGVNFFDNAEIYANGESEKVMGKLLRDFNWERSSYVVSSKAFFGQGGKLPNQRGLSRKHVVEACHAALRRLQVEYLDLFFCHRPDKNTPMEEVVFTMNHLIQQGKIFYWGTSEWSAMEIMEAHMIAKQNNLIGPTMEQPQYNMLHRNKVEVEYSKIYETVGLGTTIWSPLASGTLTSKYIGKIPDNTRMSLEEYNWLRKENLTESRLQTISKVNDVAKELGVSLAQLAIRWCVANKNVSTVILGASKLSQLEENLKTIDAIPELSAEMMDKIDLALDNKPQHPPY